MISHLIKPEGKEIFNNAALALFLVSVLGLKVSWWGTNVNFFVVATVVFLGIINAYFSKKVLPTVIFILVIKKCQLDHLIPLLLKSETISRVLV